MSFVGDVSEAIGLLGQTLVEYLPQPIAKVFERKDIVPTFSSEYEEFKSRIELACQVQLLKKSIEDKGLLSSKDRIEVFSCVCVSWALTHNAEEAFEQTQETLSDEAEDLLYVSSYMQKENDIKTSYIKLFEASKTTHPDESLILTKEIQESISKYFEHKEKRVAFYQKPFHIMKMLFKDLPLVKLDGGMKEGNVL